MERTSNKYSKELKFRYGSKFSTYDNFVITYTMKTQERRIYYYMFVDVVLY